MIRHHLKDSLHWLRLFCFKRHTFAWETQKLSRRQALAVFLKVYSWLFVFSLILLAIFGLVCDWMRVPFNWQPAFTEMAVDTLVLGPTIVLIVELSGLLGIDLLGGKHGHLLTFCLLFMPGIGLMIGSIFGLNLSNKGAAAHFIYFSVFCTIFYTLFDWRLYYWPFHLAQFWRARRSGNWLARFRHSPVHWDETIGAPLPWLSYWLFRIAKDDRDVGLKEVQWITASRPFQSKAAKKALVKLAAHDLRQIRTVAQMAQVAETLELVPRFVSSATPKRSVERHTNVALLRIEKIVALAQDYLLRHTPIGQHKALLELQRELQAFQQAMALLPAPTGPEFQQVAAQWQATVNTAEAELRARLPFGNPFIAGNPLKEHEENLFRGRRDLVVKLEEAIFTQRPALLLYGRRRTGKTSTLLNLPRLMSSQFVPVFIDCQNARWGDSDAMFCYHLTRALHDELVKRKLPLQQEDGLAQPQKDEFTPHAFTRLDEFLDELEAHSRRLGKQILLTFDEYERLEEGLRDGKLTRAVLNQIRAIVQHRERLIVLFSGSHRFEELQTVNWSDYLINVQTLYLSFLTRAEARELIEHPTPEFALGYAPGVVDRVLDLTHGQPYLVQALGSELVNLINREKRKEATLADLDVVVGRVLVAVEAYFENNWRDCNEAEQAVLRGLATQQADALAPAERQRALLSLSHKELVEQRDGHWQFTVELFRLWVKQEKTAEMFALSAA